MPLRDTPTDTVLWPTRIRHDPFEVPPDLIPLIDSLIVDEERRRRERGNEMPYERPSIPLRTPPGQQCGFARPDRRLESGTVTSGIEYGLASRAPYRP